MKVCYYGFMNPSYSVSLDKIAALIEIAFGFTIVVAKSNIEAPKPMTCPHCGGNLLYRFSILPFRITLSGGG